MRARTFVSVAVISALGFLTPMQSYAFGLGKIELSSALNEPFKARIPVTALRDDDGNLRVKLASNVEFEKAGLQRSFLLTQLNFEVVEEGGVTTILINSSQPVKEPFLDFLVTVATSNGRLIREYTVLLDPPKNVFIKAPAAQKSKASSSVKMVSPKKATYQYPAANAEKNSTKSYLSATSYTIGQDDTLWNIARDTKPESAISIHQMMMALQKANPSAFYNNNINSIKAGHTLDIPTAAEIKQLSRSQAYAAAKEQNIEWKNRNRQNTTVIDTPMQDDVTASSDSNATTIEPQQFEPLANVDESNNARLKLVVPNDDSEIDTSELSPLGDSELVQLSDQLTLAQETIESQAQENIDLKTRMDMMEEQLQILRRLVTLEAPELAQMQSTLQANQDELTETLDEDGLVVEQEELIETLGDELIAEQEELVETFGDELVVEQEEFIETLGDELVVEQEELIETLGDELVAEQEELVETFGDELIAEQEELVETLEDELVVEQDELIELAEEGVMEQSNQSEVDAYFAQLEADASTIDEMAIEDDGMGDEFPLIPLDESSDGFDEMVDNTLTPLSVDDATESEQPASILDKMKGFYLKYKNESLIAGLVALIGLILLMLKARRKEEFEWEDGSEGVASTSTTVGVAVSGVSDNHESTVAIDKTDEDLINDAYASLDDADVESKSTATLELEPELAAIIASDEGGFDKTQAIVLGEEDSELNTDSEQDETVVLDTLLEDIEDVKELESEDEPDLAEKELEFNLEELSTDADPEENLELEANVLEKDVKEDSLDFDLDMSINTDDDEPVLELDNVVEPSSDEIEFDGSLTLDDGDNNELTLNDEPLSLDIENDLNEITLDDSPLELDLNDDNFDSLELDTNLSPPDLELDALDADLTSLDVEEGEPLVEFETADLSDTLAASSESELEFDLGNFDEIDEAETKLDLASAYMDMGDPEGARSILEEVLSHGNDEQKGKAQSLLNGLS